MKTLIVTLIVIFLSGCTTYSIEKQMGDGVSTIVKIKSTRDLEQPEITYIREGEDARFDFKAASVDNNSDMFAGMMMQMLQMMMQQQAVPQ